MPSEPSFSLGMDEEGSAGVGVAEVAAVAG
jgi:hypothetical protein